MKPRWREAKAGLIGTAADGKNGDGGGGELHLSVLGGEVVDGVCDKRVWAEVFYDCDENGVCNGGDFFCRVLCGMYRDEKGCSYLVLLTDVSRPFNFFGKRSDFGPEKFFASPKYLSSCA